MSNKVRKTAKMTAQPKDERFIPTAEECARELGKAAQMPGSKPIIWDPTISGDKEDELGGFRPMTQGEITKGQRYLKRTAKRIEYNDREEAIRERNARYREQLDRIADAARKRAKAAEALKKMPAPSLAKLP